MIRVAHFDSCGFVTGIRGMIWFDGNILKKPEVVSEEQVTRQWASEIEERTQ